MSAARRRGLVMRGASACQWDGGKYVRVFGARRCIYLLRVELAAVGTARDLGLLLPFRDGPIDAPEIMPAGACRNDGNGGVGGGYVWRSRGAL